MAEGVQLPKVTRTEVQSPTSSARIEGQVQSVAEIVGASNKTTQAVASKITEVFDARQATIEKRAIGEIDIRAANLKNTYTEYSKTLLKEIGLKTGDTAKDYENYDKQMAQKYDELTKEFGEWKPEYSTLVTQKLQAAYAEQNGDRSRQQTEQNYKFRKSVVNSSVALNQDGFYNRGLTLNAKDPRGMIELDAYVGSMMQARIAEGDQDGTLARDENGMPKVFEGAVGVQVRKDVGDVVKNLVTTLNGAGKVNEAKMVLDKYSEQYMNADDRDKLMSQGNEANVKNIALAELSKLGENASIADINKTSQPEAVKFKMREIKDINDRLAKNDRDRKTESAFQSEYTRVIGMQNSGNPYVSKAQYLDSPEAKNLLANGMKPDQIDKIADLAVVPIKSKPDALSAYTTGLKNNNLYLLPYAKLTEIKAGLNAEDRKRFDSDLAQQKSDAKKSKEGGLTSTTGSELQSSMVKELDKKMKGFKLNGEPVFPTKKNRNGTGEDFEEDYDKELLNTTSEFIKQDIQSFGKMPSYSERQQIIETRFNEMLSQRQRDSQGLMRSIFGPDKYKERAYVPIKLKRPNLTQAVSVPAALVPTSTASGTTPTTQPALSVSPSGVVKNLPDAKDRNAWIKIFKDNNNRMPGAKELIEYINTQTQGK
jgi:hypothetical protein